jgi:hypothetical protein
MARGEPGSSSAARAAGGKTAGIPKATVPKQSRNKTSPHLVLIAELTVFGRFPQNKDAKATTGQYRRFPGPVRRHEKARSFDRAFELLYRYG